MRAICSQTTRLRSRFAWSPTRCSTSRAAAMSRPVRVNDGKKVRADEAMELKPTALAIGGDQDSFRILSSERKARLKKAPPGPTEADLAQQQADEEEKAGLAAKLVDMFELIARLKKSGVLVTVDGRLGLAAEYAQLAASLE